MNNDSHLTGRLAAQQEEAARKLTFDQPRIERLWERTHSQPGADNREYHIHTEAKGDLASLVGRYFEGATISYGVGFYEGVAEPSATIIVYGTEADLDRIFWLAADIKQENQQQAVDVVWFRVSRATV